MDTGNIQAPHTADSYLEIHLSNELVRLQGKLADCDPLLKTGYHQKNLKRENIINNIIVFSV